MKITTFNPLIVTKDAGAVIQLFESLGFKQRHRKDGVSDEGITDVRMKDDNGFYVDVAQWSDIEKDTTLIRINVDNLDEAIELLMARGFRRGKRFNETVDTGSSRFNIMVSPSGYILDVSQHIKDRD